jgi:hypothetical protein
LLNVTTGVVLFWAFVDLNLGIAEIMTWLYERVTNVDVLAYVMRGQFRLRAALVFVAGVAWVLRLVVLSRARCCVPP